MRHLHRVVPLFITLAVAASPGLHAQRVSGTAGPQRADAGTVPRSIGTLLPGTRINVRAMIQGSALTSTDGVLADSAVRLRDARFGRIIGAQRTDRAGLFEFRAVDPGTYIVELFGDAQSVVATSQMLNVGAGETVSTVVKMPYRIAPLAGLLGHTVGSATAVLSAAAASGVLATAVTGEPASPIVPVNPPD